MSVASDKPTKYFFCRKHVIDQDILGIGLIDEDNLGLKRVIYLWPYQNIILD